MRNRALRGCLITLILLIGNGISASKEMHPKLSDNQTKVQKADDKKQRASHPPIIVNVSPPQKTHDEIEQEAKDREEKAENDRKIVEFTRKLADYTFGLFVATAALVMATVCLGYLGWRQARDMKESIRIAERSAEAALKSADAADRALVGVDAPFLFPTVEFPIKAIVGDGLMERRGKAAYKLKNFGRVPAIIREMYDGCVISNVLPDPIRFPPLQSPTMKMEIIAASGESRFHEPANSIAYPSADNMDAAAIDPNMAIFIVGQVRYTDVFQNTIYFWILLRP
jgi:hypothetical protein